MLFYHFFYKDGSVIMEIDPKKQRERSSLDRCPSAYFVLQ